MRERRKGLLVTDFGTFELGFHEAERLASGKDSLIVLEVRELDMVLLWSYGGGGGGLHLRRTFWRALEGIRVEVVSESWTGRGDWCCGGYSDIREDSFRAVRCVLWLSLSSCRPSDLIHVMDLRRVIFCGGPH